MQRSALLTSLHLQALLARLTCRGTYSHQRQCPSKGLLHSRRQAAQAPVRLCWLLLKGLHPGLKLLAGGLYGLVLRDLQAVLL